MIAKPRDEQQDIERFSRWSESYERSRIQRYIDRIHHTMLTSLANEGGSPDTVLDVGCGTGRLLRKTGQRWPAAQLIGIDPAEGMIAVARRLAPSASFHVASAESIPVGTASIDLALSAISFHHWGDQLRGLQELARILRPGGYLCLSDITMPRWLSKIVHSKAQSPGSIARLIAQVELELQTQQCTLARTIVVAVAAKPATAA